MKEKIAVFLIYLFITSIIFLPFADGFINKIIAGNDSYFFTWLIWHFEENFPNIYYTNAIFYPEGIRLFLTTLTPINTLFSVIVKNLLNLSYAQAYHIHILLSFPLAGLTMYILTKYITKNKKSAFLAGLIFSFCVYHYAQAYSHGNLAHIEWLPLMFYYYLKLRDENNMKDLLFATLTIILTFSSEVLYLAMFLMVIGGYNVYLLFKKKKIEINRKHLISFGIGMLVLSPIIYNMYLDTLDVGITQVGYFAHLYYCSNLETYLLPLKIELWGSSQLFPFTEGVSSVEFIHYLGWITLILAFFNRKGNEQYLILALIALILSIGPAVKAFNTELYPSPLFIFSFIPIVNMIRVPARYSIFVLMFLSIPAAQAAKKMKYWQILGLSSLILVETFFIPAFMGAELNDIYSKLEKEGAILELPAKYNNIEYSMYKQTEHGIPLYLGVVSRFNNFTTSKLINISCLASLNESICEEFNWNIYENLKIRYISIDKPNILNTSLIKQHYEKVYENEQTEIYQVN